MRWWQGLLLIVLLVTLPTLPACGPSQAELEQQRYEEYLKAHEEAQQRIEAEQQAKKEKELADVRNWCIKVAMIIQNDSDLVDSWNEFRQNFDRITPYSSWDVKTQQEEEFFKYMECYEKLSAEINSLSCPTACYKAHKALSNYLRKQRPAIKDLVIYYASGQDYYRLQHNEKLVEIHGLRTQYLNEFFKIIDEWKMQEVLLPYIGENVTSNLP